jgi:hypothetical protein
MGMMQPAVNEGRRATYVIEHLFDAIPLAASPKHLRSHVAKVLRARRHSQIIMFY